MNRFYNFHYVLFSIKIKLTSLFYSIVNRFKSPYERSMVEVIPSKGVSEKNYSDKYLALSYFNYSQCIQFHKENEFITISLIKALVYYNEVNRKDEYFLQLVDTISRRGHLEAGKLIFYIDTPLEKYNLSSGFYSGLVQGKAASLFVRAYMISKNTSYLTLAQQCLYSYLTKVEDGGVLRRLQNDILWVEEYPDPKKASLVLNGHIFTIIGLAEYLSITDDAQLSSLYDSLLQSTVAFLPTFKVRGGILYSLRDWKLCNVHYLSIMQPLLKHIYVITEIEEFMDFHNYLKQISRPKLFKKITFY